MNDTARCHLPLGIRQEASREEKHSNVEDTVGNLNDSAWHLVAIPVKTHENAQVSPSRVEADSEWRIEALADSVLTELAGGGGNSRGVVDVASDGGSERAGVSAAGLAVGWGYHMSCVRVVWIYIKLTEPIELGRLADDLYLVEHARYEPRDQPGERIELVLEDSAGPNLKTCLLTIQELQK